MSIRASPLRITFRYFGVVLKLSGWLIWKTFKWTILTLALLLTLVSLLAIGYAIHYVYWDKNDLPTINSLMQVTLPSITEVKDTNSITLAEFATEYRKVITYQDIHMIIEAALLSAEDKRFWQHDGKDSMAILRAGWEIFKASVDKSRRLKKFTLSFVEGGSTITQQYIRLSMPEIRKSELSPKFKGWQKDREKIKRKLKEIKLAVWAEKELAKIYGSKRKAKEEILARFVNMVYLDFGRYGLAAAAEFYFNQPLYEFTMNDANKAALLAAMIKSPAELSPFRKPNLESKRTQTRRNEILNLMVANKYLSLEEGEKQKKKPVEVETRSKVKTIAPAAITHMFSHLPSFGLNQKNIFQGNIEIRLTVDERMQNAANEALENGLMAYGKRHPENADKIQGAIVVLRNSDGAILAEVGGKFFKNDGAASYTEFNRVTQAKRPPGSAFKPFTYLTALEVVPTKTIKGWRLDCKQENGGECKVKDVFNVCIPMGKGRPSHCIKNYDSKFKGLITLRQCLGESRNACTTWLAWKKLGIKKVIETAQRTGIKSPLENYPTTVLGGGGAEVTLLELTNAFRTIAAGGILVEPYIIEEIKDAQGLTVTPVNEGRVVLNPIIALRMQEALRGTIRLPLGTGSSLDNTGTFKKNRFPFPIAGKTGTTDDFKDALFVGFTAGPDGITIGIRLGIDDGTLLFDENKCRAEGRSDCKSLREPGGKSALPIFKELIQAIYRDVAPENFSPEIEKNIDNYLGKKYNPPLNETTDESDEQPKEYPKSPEPTGLLNCFLASGRKGYRWTKISAI